MTTMMRRITARLCPARKPLLAGAAVLVVAGSVLAGLLYGPRLEAQPRAATLSAKPSGPKFEVASVKPAPAPQAVSKTGQTPHIGIKLDPARVDIGWWSIKQLILRAYGLWPYQVSGPEFVDSLRFDVAATFPEGANQNQLPGMLQWLLAERFGLVAHVETRDLPAFALVAGKGGPKMKSAPPDAETPANPASKEQGYSNRAASVGRILDGLFGYGMGGPFGLTAYKAANGDLHMAFTKMPMAALAQILASYLNAPVIDGTGLPGRYQATLDFSLADTVVAVRAAQALEAGSGAGAPVTASEPSGGSLFAMVKRLGLALERRHAPVEVLVVDHLERVPKEN